MNPFRCEPRSPSYWKRMYAFAIYFLLCIPGAAFATSWECVAEWQEIENGGETEDADRSPASSHGRRLELRNGVSIRVRSSTVQVEEQKPFWLRIAARKTCLPVDAWIRPLRC